MRLEGIEPRPGAAEDSTTEHRGVSPYGSDEMTEMKRPSAAYWPPGARVTSSELGFEDYDTFAPHSSVGMKSTAESVEPIL